MPETPNAPAPAPAEAPKKAAKPATKPRAPKPTSGTEPKTAPPSKTPAPKPSEAPPRKAPLKVKRAAPAAPTGTVIDVSGLVLGRASSQIAQRLLRGESIVVVCAEKSVVTGSRSNVLGFYTANRARGSKRTGPHYPRYPDRIFRRTVRGMLPHLKTRGKQALDRLEVFMGCPAGLAGAPKQTIEVAKARPALRPPMTLEEITRLLGARV